MYYRGEGVSVNFVEAIKWFRLAVDQEDVVAQHGWDKCTTVVRAYQ